jgi:preprotein translocase subunit SecD
MRRYYINLVIVAVLLGLAIWSNLPSNPGVYLGSFQRTMQIIYGLDLRGGVEVLLQAEAPQNESITTQGMNDAMTIFINRTNALGVSENQFNVVGQNLIAAEFPGLKDPTDVLSTIKNTGQLEFVDLGSNPENLREGAIIVTSNSADKTPPANAASTTVWKTIMTGKDLTSVSPTTTGTGGYQISFTLSTAGAQLFGAHTAANIGKTLAIILDKKIISAPTINDAIPDGQGIITGSFTVDEANSLAIQMRFGALPYTFKVVESRLIGPTLGADSLNKSLLAGVIGLTIVLLFMVIYYRLPGLVAALSIIVYALITLTFFRLIPVTLTLAGIAGFLLGTGSALDANILIFERFKEELRAGRTYFQAIDLGWRRAWPSIRDSNLATLITCGVLLIFGTQVGASIVKGFAVNLALGVIVSIFCAYFATLTLMHVLVELMKPNAKHFKWFGILD